MLKPIKHLGQNYLQDPNTARKIVDTLRAGKEDPIVEIGPGTGALTGILVDRFEHVTAIEIDHRAADLLREQYPSADIREQDVLEIDWAALASEIAPGSRLHVIGNLPYYITSEILFGLLDAQRVIEEVVIMMQYEVAKRLVAETRTKAYGILSVAVQEAGEVELMFPVSRNVFYPKPDVRSAVVRLGFDPHHERTVDVSWLRHVVRTAFNQRRKTLRNSLRSVTDDVGRDLPDDISGKRAEELTPDEFVELARYLQHDGTAD